MPISREGLLIAHGPGGGGAEPADLLWWYTNGLIPGGSWAGTRFRTDAAQHLITQSDQQGRESAVSTEQGCASVRRPAWLGHDMRENLEMQRLDPKCGVTVDTGPSAGTYSGGHEIAVP